MTTTQNIETWIGFRNGLAVSTYSSRFAADAALTRYEIDMAAPAQTDTCADCGTRISRSQRVVGGGLAWKHDELHVALHVARPVVK